MSEERPLPPDRPSDDDRIQASPWVRRVVVALVLVVVAFLAYRAGAALLPRWWAQRVADQVNGDFTSGVLWGLFYGFVFTAVPLLVLAQVRRRFLPWKAKLVVAVVAVLLAAPNWLTLGIVTGNSSSAHAGERIFDVDGPGFRWASLWGAVAGVAVAAVVVVASVQLGHRRRQVKDLKGQIRERDARDAERERGAREDAGE